jgi:uncharacterized protein (DUF983 family)
LAIAQGLSYCNHCGARLSVAKGDDTAKQSELFPDALVWAIVSVFVVGLGCIIGLMAVMKNLLNLNSGMIFTVTMLSFMLMLAIEGVFIWQLLSRKRAAQEASEITRLKEQMAKELDAASARTLSEPVPSVTEHATRPFEPIYSKRKEG